MPEVLHTDVVGARTLGTPTPGWDPATRAALDRELEAARHAAYDEGFVAGRDDATARVAGTVAAISGAVDALRDELAGQRSAALARDLARVEAVVTAVLEAAPPPATQVLAGRLRDAIARLDDPTLPVRLHPDDLAVIAPLLDDPRVELTADPSLAPGDARVEGTWGRAELTRAAVTRTVLEALAEDVGDDRSTEPTGDVAEVRP